MFEGGSYHFKYAVPRGETHEDLLDCFAMASNVRDGPVSSQAYRMSCVPRYRWDSWAGYCSEAVLTCFAFMGLVADHNASTKPFSALQPYPTLQLLDRLRGHRSALKLSRCRPLRLCDDATGTDDAPAHPVSNPDRLSPPKGTHLLI